MNYGRTYGRRTSTGTKVGVFALVFLGGLLLAAVLSLVAAIPMFFLWNWLMPAVFGLKVITFWQAWGLLLLASILFKPSSVDFKAKSD